MPVPLTSSSTSKARAGTIFHNCEKSDDGNPLEKVIKVPFKANYFLNSTMMASFLPVIVSKKNKQTEKNMSFIAVYITNSHKS